MYSTNISDPQIYTTAMARISDINKALIPIPAPWDLEVWISKHSAMALIIEDEIVVHVTSRPGINDRQIIESCSLNIGLAL